MYKRVFDIKIIYVPQKVIIIIVTVSLMYFGKQKLKYITVATVRLYIQYDKIVQWTRVVRIFNGVHSLLFTHKCKTCSRVVQENIEKVLCQNLYV